MTLQIAPRLADCVEIRKMLRKYAWQDDRNSATNEATMQLLVIRHGKAEDREKFSAADSDDNKRPLTSDGIEKMIAAAKGLRKLVDSIDLIVTSPLKRAVQTARIVADAFGQSALIEREELTPGTSSEKLLRWLRTNKAESTIAIVGHEPDLSQFISYLLTGIEKPIVEMKKGAVCLLESTGKIIAAKCAMKFLLTAKQLSRQ